MTRNLAVKRRLCPDHTKIMNTFQPTSLTVVILVPHFCIY